MKQLRLVVCIPASPGSELRDYVVPLEWLAEPNIWKL